MSDHPEVRACASTPAASRAVNPCPKAFTIVELLAVISIIGLLLALLIPAVLRARSAARRTDCLHRMGQVGQALNSFAISKGHYPGYVDRILTYGTYMDPHGVTHVASRYRGLDGLESWVTKILPELGQGSLQEAIIDFRRPPQYRQIVRREFNVHTWEVVPFLPVLACPSDTSFATNRPCLSFVVNCGVGDPATPDLIGERDFVRDSRANGIFQALPSDNHRKHLQMGPDYIASHDGTANTLMLSENLDASLWHLYGEVRNGFCWWTRSGERVFGVNVRGGESPVRKERIWKANRNVHNEYHFDHRFARPSSHHTGGVNVVFSDGHGQFLREDIEYWVYVQLMTPDGKNAAIDAHNKVPAPPEYRQLLSPSDFR